MCVGVFDGKCLVWLQLQHSSKQPHTAHTAKAYCRIGRYRSHDGWRVPLRSVQACPSTLIPPTHTAVVR